MLMGNESGDLVALKQRIDAGRAAWPTVVLDDDAFARHVASLGGDGLPPLQHAADLWLACACALGDPGAIVAFERAHRATIERAIGKIDRAFVDEGTQAILVSLLVRTPEAAPRVATYGGRSSLRTWLATVATHAAFKMARRPAEQPHESVGGLTYAIGDEPEIALAKARYRPELEAALRAALAGLDARQAVLLRLHHGQGWSIDRLGESYRVGRSTAARWVAAARDALLAETKRVLRERLGLTPSELQSIVMVLRSEIDASLVRLLDARAAEATAS